MIGSMTAAPRSTATASAPILAYVVAGGAFLLGLAGSMLALTLFAFTSAVDGLQLALQGVVGAAVVLLTGFAIFGVTGLAGLIVATRASASVGSDGWFRVRSWPPWRTRTVDLRQLERITSRMGPARQHSLFSMSRETTVLQLHARGQQPVDWNAAFWRGSAPVLAAIRAAAVDSGAWVEPDAVALLDASPVYSRSR